jgi:hypothetical protein
LGLGHLGIPAEQFWRYSIVEWYAALDGYMVKIGAKDALGEGITRDEYEALKEQYPDDRGTS